MKEIYPERVAMNKECKLDENKPEEAPLNEALKQILKISFWSRGFIRL